MCLKMNLDCRKLKLINGKLNTQNQNRYYWKLVMNNKAMMLEVHKNNQKNEILITKCIQQKEKQEKEFNLKFIKHTTKQIKGMLQSNYCLSIANKQFQK